MAFNEKFSSFVLLSPSNSFTTETHSSEALLLYDSIQKSFTGPIELLLAAIGGSRIALDNQYRGHFKNASKDDTAIHSRKHTFCI